MMEAEETRSGKLLRQIKEICEIAGIKTEEYAKVTKKRLDVVSLGRDLGREKAALGGRVYELSGQAERVEVLEDTTVQAVLGRLRNLEASLADCEQEISDIRDQADARTSDVKQKTTTVVVSAAEAGPEPAAAKVAAGEEEVPPASEGQPPRDSQGS